MQIKLARIIVFFPLAMLFLIPVHAAPSTLVNSSIVSGNPTVIESSTVDGTTFLTVTQSIIFTGGFQGTGFHTINVIISSTGSYTIIGKGVFTGTVTGSEPGTAEYLFTATGTFSPYIQQGDIMFGHGTGGLAGLHSEGAYQETSPTVGTLSLPVHFDP